jgi:hypothetical protein
MFRTPDLQGYKTKKEIIIIIIISDAITALHFPLPPKNENMDQLFAEAIDFFRIYTSSKPRINETKYAVGKTV